MAEFKQAFEKTITNEGNYVNDASDPGGETYKGISRNNFPMWIGWPIIDLFKKQPNFLANLETHVDLQDEVQNFYKAKFWARVQGDMILEQELANSLFDFGVNAGATTATTLAQMVTGTKPDGVMGPATIEAINTADPARFKAEFTLAKIARYISIVKKRPASRKYLYGWISRALDES